MTPTFFDSPEKLAALRAAAAQLEGTPFFANSEAPGTDGGIDCVRTLHFAYRACGAIRAIAIPRQGMDHGQHSDRSLLIEAFETWPVLQQRFACVWRRANDDEDPAPDTILPGDTICFRAGKVPHHGGLMLEHGEVLHALKGPGVHRMRLDAIVRGWRILGRAAAVYRPLP